MRPFLSYSSQFGIFYRDTHKHIIFLEVPYLIIILNGPDFTIEPITRRSFFYPACKGAPHYDDIINTYRTFAARKLAYIGPEAKLAIPSLRKSLRDRNHAVRFYAACALYKIGYEKQSQMDFLISQFGKVKSTKYLNALIDSLIIIGSESLPAVTYIEKELLHPDYLVRRYADIGITEIAGPEYAVKANKANLTNKDPEIRANALSNLSFIGSRFNIDVRETLYQAFNDENPDVIYTACQDLLERHKEPPEKILPGLIKALDKGLTSSSDSAVHRISQMGTKAKEALPALYKFVGSEQDEYIYSTMKAILKIGGKREEILKNLILRLQDSNEKNDRKVINALGEVGEESIPAIPILFEHYKREYSKEIVRVPPIHDDMLETDSGRAIRKILQSVQENTEIDYSVLEPLLKCGYQWIPEEASEAIKRKKIYLQKYAVSLSEMLVSDNINTKIFATSKLAEIGEAAAPYLPVLQEFTEVKSSKYINKYKKYSSRDVENLSYHAEGAINAISRSIPEETKIKPDVMLNYFRGRSEPRVDVLNCYLRIGGDTEKALKQLVVLLRETDYHTANEPMNIIADFNEKSYLALPMIADIYEFEEVVIRNDARKIVSIINSIKSDSKISNRDILKLMNCSNPEVIEAAIQAAIRKGATYDAISLKLAEQLASESDRIKRASSNALCKLGIKAIAALSLMKKNKAVMCHINDQQINPICLILKEIKLASQSVVSTSEKPNITVDTLLELMETDDECVMFESAEAIERLTGNFELSAIRLAKLACSGNEDISHTSFEVLWDFRYESEPALPILLEMPERFSWTKSHKDNLIKQIEEAMVKKGLKK